MGDGRGGALRREGERGGSGGGYVDGEVGGRWG